MGGRRRRSRCWRTWSTGWPSGCCWIRRSVADGERGLDQRGVGEGLRVVPEELTGPRVGFLGQQSQWPGQREQLLEQPGGLVDGAGGGQGLDEPERTGQEGALFAGQAVCAGAVPVEERTARRQLSAHSPDRARDPG